MPDSIGTKSNKREERVISLDFQPLLWLSGEEFSCNAGDASLIPGLGKSPGEGNDNPLQYSCLGNSVDRGAWWTTNSSWGRKESDMTE